MSKIYISITQEALGELESQMGAHEDIAVEQDDGTFEIRIDEETVERLELLRNPYTDETLSDVICRLSRFKKSN